MKGGTELGRVRGLGSAKQGTHHWWHQRLTAGSNLVLMIWFMVSLARLPAYDYATIAAWISSAWTAMPLILLIDLGVLALAPGAPDRDRGLPA